LTGAGLVTEFDEMRKVAGDVTFVPGDQDRVAHLVAVRLDRLGPQLRHYASTADVLHAVDSKTF
jgi:hypothetical protein